MKTEFAYVARTQCSELKSISSVPFVASYLSFRPVVCEFVLTVEKLALR